MPIGKLLVIVGLSLAAVGALLWLGQGVPWLRFGRLPGDITYEKDGVSVFIPITSMILLSLLATLVFWIVSLVRR